MRRLRVYVSGPIQKGDIATNVRKASEAHFALLKAGLAPWTPHWSVYSGGPYNAPLPQLTPNGTTCEDWYEMDLAWVAVADAVLRLPGESKGADLEVAEAKLWSIPVFYSVEEVISWAAQKNTAVLQPHCPGIGHPY